MPLEMRKTSKWWYGRYNVGGKVHCVNLEVLIDGVRPDSITQESDRKFERSRGKAQQKFDEMVAEAKAKRNSSEYVQKLHEIRTGRRIDSIPLPSLAQEWEALPRKRTVEENYVQTAKARFGRFVTFMTATYPEVETMADVSPEMAVAFMQKEEKTGLSGRTWNGVLALLKSAFRKLGHKGNVVLNPFDGIPTREMGTVHRQPFTQEELKAILDVAQGDDFIRPIFVTGICTAMRRGDSCMLRWTDVDLKANFVRVKTSKTGETVEIPLFPLLREEIEEHLENGSEFVFPEQAEMFQVNDDGITYRIQRVFEAAGFYDDEEDEEEEDAAPAGKADTRPLLPAAELLDRGLKGLSEIPEGEIEAEKRARMTEAFKLYVGGTSLPTVARKMGISKSSVSVYLREAAERTGLRVMRVNRKKEDRPTQLGNVSAPRETGVRRASIRDFHSFRVTWITIALAAGVPLEIVQRVTGHKTVDVVLKHYFRPGREDFRRTLENAMPRLFMESAQPKALPAASVVNPPSHEATAGKGDVVVYQEPATPAAMIRAAIEAMEKQTARNWKAQRDEALRSLAGAAEWVEGRILHEKQAGYARV